MLQISRILGVYTHDAIYMGGKRVIHIFTPEGGTKATSQARNDPWSKFIGDVNSWFGTVSVVVYRLRIRTVGEITKEAENLVREQFGSGQYNFLLQNCQHFASYCCTGQQMSLGTLNALAILNSIGIVFNPPMRGSPLDRDK
jgi:hypothetical protein